MNEVDQVVGEATQAQEANPQNGPKELLSLVVSAVLKDGSKIDEPMDITIPHGLRNYAGVALNIWNILVNTGGLSHKISEKEFEFYMIPDIAKFQVEFGHISAASAPAAQ